MKSYSRKRMFHKAAAGILCAGMMFANVFSQVLAEGKAQILQAIADGENLRIYVSGLGEFTDTACQIGREPAEVAAVSTGVSGHTIILLDNSLSVTKENLSKIKEIIKQYAERKPESEKISVAIFGADSQYLIEEETDCERIAEVLDTVANEDKDSFLTDVLYDVLQEIEGHTEYTRFLVVTDGVDNKAIGYTKEELTEYLKTNKHPVYSIGCRYKANEEQLKNLFAISRLTNADYYLLDDYEDYGGIIDGLCEQVTCVEVKVPDELRDGSTKNILISFETADGLIEAAGELSMPFQVREETELEEEMPVEDEEPVEEEEPAAEEPPAKEDAPPVEEPVEEVPSDAPEADYISIGAAAVIIFALTVFLIMKFKKKKGGGAGRDKKQQKETPLAEEDIFENTIQAGQEGGGETVFLNSRKRVKYIVVLRDHGEADKIFKYPLSDKVVIGRKHEDGVNIVLNYEGSVSARHCEVSMRGERFYVRDLQSSNGTFINGQPVGDYVEFTSGSTIKMGNLIMTIEIEQVRQ